MRVQSDAIPMLAAFVAEALNGDAALAERVDALRSRDEPLIDVAEVTERLGLKDEGTVRAMAREGRLPGYRVGREWRFLWSEVRASVLAGRLES